MLIGFHRPFQDGLACRVGLLRQAIRQALAICVEEGLGSLVHRHLGFALVSEMHQAEFFWNESSAQASVQHIKYPTWQHISSLHKSALLKILNIYDQLIYAFLDSCS